MTTMHYVGTAVVKMDDKGRFFVPAQYRATLIENSMLVYRGDHLALYDQERFAGFVSRLVEKVDEGVIEREDLDLMMEFSEHATIDSQGRLVVPRNMRQALGLEKGAIAVRGRSDHLAIEAAPADAVDSADMLISRADRAKALKAKVGI